MQPGTYPDGNAARTAYPPPRPPDPYAHPRVVAEPWQAAGPADRRADGDAAEAPPGDDTRLWVLRLAKGVVFFAYAVVAACLALLTTAFVLRLFGASTDAGFTEWAYRNVDRLMEPFRGMFPSPALSDRSVVDFSLLFAMIVYAVAAIGLHALVSWLARQVVAANRATRVGHIGPVGPVSPGR